MITAGAAAKTSAPVAIHNDRGSTVLVLKSNPLIRRAPASPAASPITIPIAVKLAGLRRSELRGLRWEDYDGEQIMAMGSVWEGFTNDRKTKRSKPPVPVIPRLQAILAALNLICGNLRAGQCLQAAQAILRI